MTRTASASAASEATARYPVLVTHAFESALDGRRHLLRLPPSSQVLVQAGRCLEPGQTWCRVLPAAPPVSWSRLCRREKWQNLDQVFGGSVFVELAQRAWFEHQAVKLDCTPGEVLFPAELVSLATRDCPPAGLWWDLSPCEQYVDSFIEAAILPPLKLTYWHSLRFTLPGDVLLNASIADPRLAVPRDAHNQWPRRRDPWRSRTIPSGA